MARRMTPAEMLCELAPAVACVEVIDANGKESVGTAFHVGGGLYVTAAHVFEGKSIKALSTTLPTTQAEKDGWRQPLYSARTIPGVDLTLSRHPDPSVDVAVIRSTLDAAVIPLGLHLEDSMTDTYLVLEQVIVMGYPPIPCMPTSLICSRGEINACLRPYVGSTRAHFVISPMARGGFSGGPALLAETGECIGVVTQSFVADDKPEEHGYFSVLTVGSILELLRDAQLIPNEQPQVADLYEMIEYARRLRDERDGTIPTAKRPETFFVIGIHLDTGRVNHGGTHDLDEAIERARSLAAEHAGGRWAIFFVEGERNTHDRKRRDRADAEIARFVVPDAGFLAHPRREPE